MLEDKIYQDYQEALKSRDKRKIDFLSFIRAKLKNQAIQLKKDKLTDEEVLVVLKKQYKSLTEARESVSSSGRQDIIDNLDFELSILKEYLPSPLSEKELQAIIDEAISSSGASSMKDMGKVMKNVLSKVGVRAEAKLVSGLVKKKLQSPS